MAALPLRIPRAATWLRLTGVAVVVAALSMVGAAYAANKKPDKSAATAAKAKPAAKPASDAKSGKDAKSKDPKASKDAKSAKDGKAGKEGGGKGKGGKGDDEGETVPGKPNLKIRQGSMLRHSDGEPESVDLRGELERRRDQEMQRHYARLAELDVIDEVAARENDAALSERVEAVRRKEERRYWAVMQRLKGEAWQKLARGAP